jgi:uncharacterized protein
MTKVMSPKLRVILSELQRELRKLYGTRLAHLVLYGSQARGEAETYSDIDVLVVLKGPVDSLLEIERAGYAVADISLRYNTVLSCLYVSEERYAQEKSPLLLNIHREGVLV